MLRVFDWTRLIIIIDFVHRKWVTARLFKFQMFKLINIIIFINMYYWPYWYLHIDLHGISAIFRYDTCNDESMIYDNGNVISISYKL